MSAKTIRGVGGFGAGALALIAVFLFLGQTQITYERPGQDREVVCKSVAEAGWPSTITARADPGTPSSGLTGEWIESDGQAVAESVCDRRRTMFGGVMAFLLAVAAALAVVGALWRPERSG